MTYRRGEGSGGAGGVIAPPIFLEIGKILKSIPFMGSLFSLELTPDLSPFFEFCRCY